MLKLIGAVLLAGGGLALGFSAAAQLERRVRALRELVGAVEVMERELTFRLTPMPELLASLAKRTREPVSRFFTACLDSMKDLGEYPLSVLWENALAEVPMDLGAEEREVLRALGGVLGRYDGDGQREALALLRVQLSHCLERAMEDRTRLGRVYGVLGLTAGAFLVILLL